MNIILLIISIILVTIRFSWSLSDDMKKLKDEGK